MIFLALVTESFAVVVGWLESIFTTFSDASSATVGVGAKGSSSGSITVKNGHLMTLN